MAELLSLKYIYGDEFDIVKDSFPIKLSVYWRGFLDYNINDSDDQDIANLAYKLIINILKTYPNTSPDI